jgi:hypothetical protein
MYSSNSRTYFRCAQRNLQPPQVEASSASPVAHINERMIADALIEAGLVTGMYGPPHDCKGKLRGEKTSLRKCIRPLMEISYPGHDELRACLSL